MPVFDNLISTSSAYVVHANPETIRTTAAQALFAQSVVKWMETKVAKHKFLRGGKLDSSTHAHVSRLTLFKALVLLR